MQRTQVYFSTGLLQDLGLEVSNQGEFKNYDLAVRGVVSGFSRSGTVHTHNHEY